ncbi:PTS sugar transporter subunit IIC [Dolosigranulum pigrum]|uniref:PTS sugar transporter subunit IIC n=1 Tax=Dolosigranulum pigrum TaxID=29394 RepID=UPI00242D79F2|nr:PTS sugar transporter subunit IIC [Dolosigranulum pigrum]
MENLRTFFENKFAPVMSDLAEQRHLRAIRDGIIATLPLIIIGSMFLVIGFLPNQLPDSWAFTQFIAEYQFEILLPYRMTMYIMTLYAVFGIGASLANSYKLDKVSGGILAETAFLMTIVPQMIEAPSEELMEIISETSELQAYIDSITQGFVLPMPNLGSAGMFVGIIMAIFAVEVYRFTETSGFRISMPEEVPESVARSFESLTPAAIIILVTATITMWLDIDVHSIIGKLIEPLITATDSLPSVIIIVLLTLVFWSFGIHGVSIMGTIMRPLWLSLLDVNAAAVAGGTEIPHIAAEPFYQWFIWIGGSGATIGLAICLAFFSKSKYANTLGKTSIIPAIFNINEPIIFGAPIVLNPILIVPFVISPLVLSVIAWVATSLGFVNRVVTLAPWTLPGPIGAYLATGGDWRAAVLNIILIIIAVLIYYPFFRIYDNNLLKEEGNED